MKKIMFQFLNIFNLKSINSTIMYKSVVFLKRKNFKFRNEKVTIFHLNKIYFNFLKKHTRKRKIHFYMMKKNSNKLFLFNKPKSTLVKKKRK